MSNALDLPKSLKLEDWPTQDRALWETLTRTGDIFDDQGAAGHWSEIYKTQMAYAYGRWLSFKPRECSI